MALPGSNTRSKRAPAAVSYTVHALGQQIASARLRRGWTQKELATKAGINRLTLRKIEAGETTTGIGAYVAVLWAMGLHHPVSSIATIENDPEGSVLAEARLGQRARHRTSIDDDF